jgi:hypothetical protein
MLCLSGTHFTNRASFSTINKGENMQKGLSLAICTVFLCGTVKAQEFILSQTNEMTVLDSYSRELETRGTAAYIDEFGYPSMINWVRASDAKGYGINASVASAGKSVMRRTVLYSLRETAAEMPLSLGWRNWAENLFAGTIGNTAEGEINTLSPMPSATEASYWKQLQSDENLFYGFRPIEDRPYAYIGTQWGHSGDNPAAITLIRWHYDPLRTASKIDAQVSFPMPGRSQFSIGTSFQPERAVSAGFRPGMSTRWVWAFGHSPLDGGCFIGAVVGNGSRIDAGISFPW